MKANWKKQLNQHSTPGIRSVATFQGTNLDILIRSNKKLAKICRLLKRERVPSCLLLPRRISCAENFPLTARN